MPADLARLLACASASAFHVSSAAGAADYHPIVPHDVSSFGTTHTPDLEAKAPPGHVWAFAYGANIGQAKLKAAGVQPANTLPAVLPGHALVFDGELGASGTLGGQGFFAKGEHAFANVRQVVAQHELKPARGVVHAITPEELKILDRSEAPIMHRELLPVQVREKGKLVSVPAWTYVSRDYNATKPTPGAGLGTDSLHEVAPSERYARLVVCGIEEQALPKSYAVALRHHLQQLGLRADSLDCSKPLQPLVSQQGNQVKHLSMGAAGSAVLALHKQGTSRRVGYSDMSSFLFTETSPSTRSQ